MTGVPPAVASELARREAQPRLAAATEGVARACLDMARRFHRGGRLLVFGTGWSAADAQHVAVEFVHPVVTGTRALPALNLTADVATTTGVTSSLGLVEAFSYQVGRWGAPDDIALGIANAHHDAAVRRGLEAAKARGMLTVGLGCAGGSLAASPAVDHRFVADGDPLLAKEEQVTTYHLLWELVHVFLEHLGGTGGPDP